MVVYPLPVHRSIVMMMKMIMVIIMIMMVHTPEVVIRVKETTTHLLVCQIEKILSSRKGR